MTGQNKDISKRTGTFTIPTYLMESWNKDKNQSSPINWNKWDYFHPSTKSLKRWLLMSLILGAKMIFCQREVGRAGKKMLVFIGLKKQFHVWKYSLVNTWISIQIKLFWQHPNSSYNKIKIWTKKKIKKLKNNPIWEGFWAMMPMIFNQKNKWWVLSHKKVKKIWRKILKIIWGVKKIGKWLFKCLKVAANFRL